MSPVVCGFCRASFPDQTAMADHIATAHGPGDRTGQRYRSLGNAELPWLKAEIRTLIAEREALAGEVERLNSALHYEQHRAGRIGTHGPGCEHWGPQHYECALAELAGLQSLRDGTGQP